MQIEIDPLSPIPLYQQLRDRVVEGIARGQLRAGDPLAPIRTLAAQFGINIATVGKGYDLLRGEGLVRTNRTAGSVIARAPGRRSDAVAHAGGRGWDDAARADWARRLATVLAEGIAQGESDEAVAGTANEVLTSFAASRADARGEQATPEGAGDER